MKQALRKLAEECGELTQAAIKVHDDKPWKQELTAEAGDVIACINKLIKLGIIDKKQLNKRIKEKA
jgi:NTP pyrophosphatase (non-canonical NTP hydrolase)